MADSRKGDKGKLVVGSRVSVTTTTYSGVLGTVRYIGPVTGKAGSWVGIELDSAIGTNNGLKYFECAQNHGIFVRNTSCQLIEPEKGKGAITVTKTKKAELNLDEFKDEEDPEEAKDRERAQKISERKRELDQRRKEKSDLKEGIEELKKKDESEQVTYLRATLEQKEAIIAKLKGEAEGLEELAGLRKALADKDSALKTLEEQLKTAQASHGEVDDQTKEMIELLTLEKEQAEENCEQLKGQVETLTREVQDLTDDIELLKLEQEERELVMKAADPSTLEVGELQLALKKLYNDYNAQKEFYEERIEELENQIGNLPALEDRLAQIPELKQEIQQKERQITELQEAIDQTSSFSDMIEQLTDQNLKHEKKIAKLKEEKSALEELVELQDLEIENNAEAEKLLSNEIANKDYELSQLNLLLEQKDENISSQERTINQYRLKVCDLQNDMESLREQLAESGEQEKLSKINDLISKNLALSNKIRMMVSSDINGKTSEIENGLLERKMQYLSEAIPPHLFEQLDFFSFDNLNSLTLTKTKSYLLARELIVHTIDLPSERAQLRWLNTVISFSMQNFANISLLEEFIFNATLPEYQELIKKVDWGQIKVINSAIDNFLAKLKEGGLSASLALDSFKLSSQEIQTTVDTYVNTQSVAVDLIRALMLVVLSIYTLYHMYGFDTSVFAGLDYKELYHKALSISYKLQFIDIEADSQALRSYVEIFVARHTAVESLVTSEELPDLSTYDWTTWLESTERDLKNITLLPSYKKPVNKSINPPWISLAHHVKSRLSKFDETSKELEETKNNLKMYSVKLVTVEKELNEAKIAKKNLEMRLKDAYANSQRLNQLELEKKRLQDREKFFEESLEAVNLELEKEQKRSKLLERELSNYLADTDEGSRKMSLPISETSGKDTALTIIRPKASAGHEELESLRALIDLYQVEKRDMTCSTIKTQIKDLPRFEGLSQKNNKSFETILECKSQLLTEVSRMKMIDLTDPNHLEEYKDQKSSFDSIRLSARTAFKGISNATRSAQKIPVGTVTFGEGSQPIEADVSLLELKRIQQLIRI